MHYLRSKHRIFYYFLLFLPYFWMILMFYLGTIPGRDLPKFIFIKGMDKIFHASFYGILSSLFFLKYLYINKYNILRAFVLSFIIGIGYGAFEETIQSFIPGRQSSIYDFFADFSGIIISLSILSIYLEKKLLPQE